MSPTPQTHHYRPDIDGLRAVAVLSVILFHVSATLIPGGFAGVDIFFVISGFLISQNILQDIEANRFSIVDFYRRRVKRIAPALLVVIAFTLIVTQLVLLPEDAERAAESAFWSVFSLPNVYFWIYPDTGYFAPASNQLPLLHLWSLGVEEQFYLFWPLILLALYKPHSAKVLIAVLIVAASGSYILGDRIFDTSPSFAYYMLPTRAGELLLGALAALAMLHRMDRKVPEKLMPVIALIGVALILGSLFLLSESQPFPGWRAIPPTLGTAMVIFAGGNTVVARALSVKPLVFVGLISYSAYLWHWPLFALYRYGYGDITLLSGVMLLALTGVIAYLSFRYIEQPARKLSGKPFKIFWWQYILPAGCLALLAVAAMKIDGYGPRWLSGKYKTTLASVKKQTLPPYEYNYVCQRESIKINDIDDPLCVTGIDSSDKPAAILLGDSNAAHYIGMVSAFAREAGFRIRNLQIGSCPPIFGDPAPFVTAKRLADCKASAPFERQALESYPVVVLAGAWTEYQEQSSDLLPALFDTVTELTRQGKLVIILGKVNPIDRYDRLCREKALSFPFVRCSVTDSIPKPAVKEINAKLEAFALKTKGVRYFDANRYLCENDQCPAFDKNGEARYFDSTHLSMAASWRLGEHILAQDGLPRPFDLIKGWSDSDSWSSKAMSDRGQTKSLVEPIDLENPPNRRQQPL